MQWFLCKVPRHGTEDHEMQPSFFYYMLSCSNWFSAMLSQLAASWPADKEQLVPKTGYLHVQPCMREVG
jgi:hypothetical protein